MLEVKTVNEVFEIIKNHFNNYFLETEEIDILESCDRIISKPVYSLENVPSFNRSLVDGYAVIASDTFGSSESAPVALQKLKPVEMGNKPEEPLKKGYSSYIPTGGEIPDNSDAVVMIEFTEDYNDEYIYINKAVAPGNNVLHKGDDIKIGKVVFNKGRRIRSSDIGVLAALGIEKISVNKKIKVGIIATGDEIIQINKKIEGSQIRDINSYFLFSSLKKNSAEPVMLGIINDDFYEIKIKVQDALNKCDIVLVSGGSSAGEKDHTLKIIDSLAKPGVLVHGIAVKPGKPTIIGKIDKKCVIGLPGHPASAFMIYTIFVKYLLDIMNNVNDEIKNSIFAILSENYPSNNGREEFVPVKLSLVNGKLTATPIFGKSGQISILSEASGYAHIKRNAEGLMKGEITEITLF